MKCHLIASIVVVLALAFSCASAPQNPINVTFARTEVEARSSGLPPAQTSLKTSLIPVTDYNLPVEDSAAGRAATDPQEAVTSNTGEFTVVPTKQSFRGGAVYYNFVPNTLYKIFLAPGMTSYVSLEPGESIISPPVAGDTYNFQAYPSLGRSNGLNQMNIILKTTTPGRNTNMTIFTDKRAYNFLLYSYEKTYMPIVSFHYPLDAQKQMAAEAEKNKGIMLNVPVDECDFSYEILAESINKPKWAPSIAFNDGKRTYLQFASAARASFAPVLFVMRGDALSVVNYHVVGLYYVVDEVIDHARLVLDNNNGNAITIKRTSE